MSRCGSRIFEKGRRSGPKRMNSALLQLWEAVLLTDVSRETFPTSRCCSSQTRYEEWEGRWWTQQGEARLSTFRRVVSGEKGCSSAVLCFIRQASAASGHHLSVGSKPCPGGASLFPPQWPVAFRRPSGDWRKKHQRHFSQLVLWAWEQTMQLSEVRNLRGNRK